MQAAMPPSERRNLNQQVCDLNGKMRYRTRSSAARKNKISPQIAQHLGQVRFTTPIKSANPGGFLLRVRESSQVAFKDLSHSVEVFPLAHKGIKLKHQCGVVFGVVAGNTVIN